MGLTRIRQIDSTHISELIFIAEDTNLNRWTAQHYLDELKNPVSIMLRLEGDDNSTIGFIVGRVVAAASDDIALDAEIYNIGVAPPNQRKGFGQALLEAFFAACHASEVGRIWLEVRETNDPAVGLYVKNGFVPVTIRKNFYSDPRENGILMRCDIPQSSVGHLAEIVT